MTKGWGPKVVECLGLSKTEKSVPQSLRSREAGGKYKSEMAEIFKFDSLCDNETQKPTTAAVWTGIELDLH